MSPTDSISTDVLIHAPIERVWALVTTAEHLGAWFADAGATIDLRPGGELSLTWRRTGTVHGRVEVVEPPHRFAFRWQTAPLDGVEVDAANATLAVFSLSAEGSSTRLVVVESGFDALDAGVEARTALLADHTAGWQRELCELVEAAS